MERLPTEIIREVCGLLCRHCQEPRNQINTFDFTRGEQQGRRALSNLCLTSSRLREIAQQFLYHRLSIRGNGGTVYMIPLLDTLISRPDLAQAAKQLILVDPDCEEETANEEVLSQETISDEVLSRLTQAARQAGLPLPDGWQTGLPLPDDWIEDLSLQRDYLMQQLLVQLPHIELAAFLSLSCYGWGLLSSVDPVTRSLPALRTVMLGRRRGAEAAFNLSKIASLFSLATDLERLSLYRCCAVSRAITLRNITHLTLKGCWVSINDMVRLLSACGELDTFIYEGSEKLANQGVGGISVNEITCILEEQGHSRKLRRLCLDYTEIDQRTNFVESLVGFSQLQEFWVGCLYISWPEDVSIVLPSSLRVIGYSSEFQQNSLSLGRRIADRVDGGFFPNLKQVTSNCPDIVLRHEFRALGIVYSGCFNTDHPTEKWV
ncbi:hypothetical protein GGR58DRAFT_454166 [Xylaria digitata]|nr:hypothetical protein GGR58DRAFT_454166 [Xylaria digitata]